MPLPLLSLSQPPTREVPPPTKPSPAHPSTHPTKRQTLSPPTPQGGSLSVMLRFLVKCRSGNARAEPMPSEQGSPPIVTKKPQAKLRAGRWYMQGSMARSSPSPPCIYHRPARYAACAFCSSGGCTFCAVGLGFPLLRCLHLAVDYIRFHATIIEYVPFGLMLNFWGVHIFLRYPCLGTWLYVHRPRLGGTPIL